jgi:anti-sigma-K factor RskA
MNAHAPFDDLVAGYALGALDTADREAFEAHLPTCETCRATLADLDRVSTGIGVSVAPIEPPASLRARTLTRATRSSRPVVPAQPLRSSVATSRWWQVAAAASLLAAIGSGVLAWSFHRQLDILRQVVSDQAGRIESMRGQLARAERAAATLTTSVGVLGSADLIRVDLAATDPASPAVGRAFVSASRGVLLQVDRLSPLRADRTYQLWLVPAGTDAAPLSAGIFEVDPSGAATVTTAIPSDVSVIAAVAVSEEPQGGSRLPTSSPLLAGVSANN